MIARQDIDQVFEALKPKMRIAVLHGASNLKKESVIYRTHQPRSWKSYGQVAEDLVESLRRLGFQHVCKMKEGMGLGQALKSFGIHCAWLNSAGIQGFGSICHAPAALESLGIPYVGHGPAQAALLDNKPMFKTWLQGAGIPTAPFMVWHPSLGMYPDPKRIEELQEWSGGPLVVKPASGRASRHVRWIPSAKRVAEAVRAVFVHTKDQVLIEPYLPGREFCITVAPPMVRTDRGFQITPRPRFLAPIERVLDAEERIFTSLDLRPIEASRIRVLREPQDEAMLTCLESVAERIFQGLNLSSIIRLDLREDRRGYPMVLEANPKPDLARRRADGRGSLIALGLAEKGGAYDELMASMIAYRLSIGLDFCLPSLGPIPDLLAAEGIDLEL